MADDKITGNEVVSSDFLKVLLALKDNTLKDCHVLELGIVKEINNNDVICDLLSNPNLKVQAIRINQMPLQINQLVLIGFNDNNFKSNLNKYIANESLQEIDAKSRHVLTNGIIITNFEVGSDGSNKANVDASNLDSSNVNDWRTKLNIPEPITSINGLSGGSLTSSLVLTGGSASDKSNIQLDKTTNGQIIDNDNYTIFGFRNNEQSNLYLGRNTYGLKFRGSGTRPQFNGNDLALKSDVESATDKLVAEYTFTSAANSITINNLDVINDGGVYDIYIIGSTGSFQWINMDDIIISQTITASYNNLSATSYNTVIGSLSQYGAGIHCTIMLNDTNQDGCIFYDSFNYDSGTHRANSGWGLYRGNGTSFTFSVNNSSVNFNTGTNIKIYKR